MDSLVKEGVELNSYYVHKYCSPTRSSYQTGRYPYHVNVLNDDMAIHNAEDQVSGFAGVPRNMTGLAEKLAQAGYSTHFGELLRLLSCAFSSAWRSRRVIPSPPPPPPSSLQWASGT